jgi:hypothetical protein
VARDAREEVPALANWARQGPFYSKFSVDDDRFHHLGFFFHRKRGKEKVGAGFTFQQNAAWARWEVWRIQKNQNIDKSRYEPIDRVCGKDGALDKGRMLRSFVGNARALGMRLPRNT